MAWSQNLSGAHSLPFFLRDYRTAPVHTFDYSFWPSQLLVWNALAVALGEGGPSPGLRVWREDPRDFDALRPEAFRPSIESSVREQARFSLYDRSFGLQAYVAYLLSRACIAGGHQALSDDLRPCFQRGFALAAAVSLSVILIWLLRNLGWGAFLGSAAFSLGSVGFVFWAINPYWLLFLTLLPTALTCLFSEDGLPGGKKLLLLLPLLFCAFLLRMLAGYEHLTAEVIAACLPLVYQAVRTNALSQGALLSFSVVATAIAAFTAALVIQEAAFGSVGHGDSATGSIQRALSWFLWQAQIDPLQNSLKVLTLSAFGLSGTLQLPSGLLVLIAIVALAAGWGRWTQREVQPRAAASYTLLAFAFAASLSWLVILPYHVLFHPLQSLLFLSFPLFLVLAAYLGEAAGRWFSARVRRDRLACRPLKP